MKKTICILAAVLAAGSVQAHRVWVETGHTHGGEVLHASLGYGEFPELETIAENRLEIFKPLQLITGKGRQNLLQTGKNNYDYQSENPVADGSYLVTAEYQPTFWSRKGANWKRTDLQGMEGAEYCEQTRMYGKNIVNVGHDSAETAVITRPVGQLLEIVPLDNPANIRVGEPFKVRVLYEGEPLPNATVTATFKGFDLSDRSKTHKVEAQAFSDTTLADGTVDIIPLRQGFWKAMVEHKTDFADQSRCKKEATYTTMTFEIGHSHH
ncbi:MAG: DUF4198 domain-containing protein [Neisseria sp.]|nr:DUF4198 domain-containing protein [Neisseria sp.]